MRVLGWLCVLVGIVVGIVSVYFATERITVMQGLYLVVASGVLLLFGFNLIALDDETP